MKLSIIIPVHNSENTIENTVNSIIGQKISYDLEIILVENGSSDNTKFICMEIAKQYEEVKFFSSKCIGPSAARNIGLDNCTGEIIGFCDADDFYEPGSLENVMQIFYKKREILLLVGSIKVEKSDGLDWLRKKNLKNQIIDDSNNLIPRILCDARIMGSVCNKFYRKELIGIIRFDEELFYCEDTYFNIAVIKNSPVFKTQIIKKNIYRYVKHGDSATKNTKNLFEGQDLKYVLTMEKIKRDFLLKGLNEDAIKKACYVIAVDNFYVEGISQSQQDKLIGVIKQGIEIHQTDIMEFTPVRNLKFLLLGRRILKKQGY